MKKFKSLIHNGVTFPKPFEGYPESIKNKTEFLKSLTALGEEMFFHYATKRDTDYVKDKVFNKNFWKNFKEEVGSKFKTISFPEDLKKEIDIIFDWNTIRKEAKKIFNKENKEKLEAEKKLIKETYGFAELDGKIQPVGLFQTEPGGIYMGRGSSPLRGYWKYQAQPEDVIINYIGPKDKEPKAPEGHKWKKVQANPNAYEIAHYYIDIGHTGSNKPKKLRFGGTSDVQVNKDQEKFEKALRLVKNWDAIETHIKNGLNSKDKKIRECAAISWLIQNTAIRIGKERSEFESQDVVGASTLKVSNIKL